MVEWGSDEGLPESDMGIYRDKCLLISSLLSFVGPF